MVVLKEEIVAFLISIFESLSHYPIISNVSIMMDATIQVRASNRIHFSPLLLDNLFILEMKKLNRCREGCINTIPDIGADNLSRSICCLFFTM